MMMDVQSDKRFLGQRNEGVQSKTIQRAVQRFAKKEGQAEARYSPYSAPQFAKALIDAGVFLEKVATLLGQSNLNSTRIYTTPGEEDLEDAVGKIED
jgi:site-specific recombinase XerD